MESGPKRLRMICEKSANYNLIGTRWTSDKQIITVAFESGSHARQGAKMDSSIPVFLRHLPWAEVLVNASKLCDCLVHILCRLQVTDLWFTTSKHYEPGIFSSAITAGRHLVPSYSTRPSRRSHSGPWVSRMLHGLPANHAFCRVLRRCWSF